MSWSESILLSLHHNFSVLWSFFRDLCVSFLEHVFHLFFHISHIQYDGCPSLICLEPELMASASLVFLAGSLMLLRMPANSFWRVALMNRIDRSNSSNLCFNCISRLLIYFFVHQNRSLTKTTCSLFMVHSALSVSIWILIFRLDGIIPSHCIKSSLLVWPSAQVSPIGEAFWYMMIQHFHVVIQQCSLCSQSTSLMTVELHCRNICSMFKTNYLCAWQKRNKQNKNKVNQFQLILSTH